MNSKTMVEKTLVVHVPENQQIVNVRLEIETNCTCTQRPREGAGSYVDAEPPTRP